jgi:hypothetical protein
MRMALTAAGSGGLAGVENGVVVRHGRVSWWSGYSP